MTISFPIASAPAKNPSFDPALKARVFIDNITVLLNGDSIASYTVDTPANASAFTDDLNDLGITATLLDGAQGGAVLTEEISASVAFWDFANDETSALYTSLIQPNEGSWTPSDVILSFGPNDAAKLTGITNNITKANWVTAYKNYIAYLKSIFPTIERVYLRQIGRHISRNDGNDEWQAAREGIDQVVNETVGVYVMADYWDCAIDGADNVHPTNAEFQAKIGLREAARINYVANGVGLKGLGPIVSEAAVSDTGLVATIQHVDGTDYTINGDPAGAFRATGNDIFSSVDSVSKTNTTTLQINCGPLTKPARLQTLYGTMDTLADNGGDNIRDNTSLILPIRYSDITATDTDLIRSITDVEYEMRPEYGKTFDSGVDVESVISANGRSFDNLNASNFMDYDSTAFGDAGGFVTTSTSSILKSEGGFAAQEDMLIGFVVELPATFSFSQIFALGTGSTPSTNCRVFAQGTGGANAGRVGWGRNQANGVTYVTTGSEAGNRLAILLDFTSLSNLDVYINDGSTPIASLDPNNAYASQNALFLGGGGAGFEFGGFFAKLGAHDATNDPSLTAIMNELKSNYNIS